MSRGFDPLELPPDRFFSWIWYLLVHNADEKQRERLEFDVNRPLPWQQPEEVTTGVWSEEEMASSFRSLASQLGVKA